MHSNVPTTPPARPRLPRVEFDPVLQAQCTLTYDADGTLLLTFGADEPTQTGNWGVVIHALRSAAIEATGGAR